MNPRRSAARRLGESASLFDAPCCLGELTSTHTTTAKSLIGLACSSNLPDALRTSRIAGTSGQVIAPRVHENRSFVEDKYQDR